MTRITHNLKLLGISVVLAICSAYIIRHPEFLMSSVLNLQEITEVKENHRDIAYKTTGDVLDIFLAGSGNYLGQLNITISHDPNIVVYTDQLTGQLPYSTLESDSGSIRIGFVVTTGIISHESLFWVPFSGDTDRILIEEATLNTTGLAVGKLSPTNVHGN